MFAEVLMAFLIVIFVLSWFIVGVVTVLGILILVSKAVTAFRARRE